MPTYDEDRPNVATGTGRVTPKGKPKNKPRDKGKGYFDWGDGKGRIHTKSKSDHRASVEAKRKYGIDLDAPVNAPLSNRQLYGMAESAADRVYGPQIRQQTALNQSVPGYFNDYVTQVGAQRQAAAQFAQPYVQTAQTAVTNAAQTAPGLDPNSPQAAKEQQAAQGRQSIAQSSANALAAIPVAADAVYGQAVTAAQRDLPQLVAYGSRQLGDLQGQRGQAVVDEYGRLRQGEQNAQIAYGTLGLNETKAADDRAEDRRRSEDKRKQRAANRKTAREKQAAANNKPITSGAFAGMTPNEVNALSPDEKTRMRDAYNDRGGDGKDRYGNTQKQRQKAEGNWSKAQTAAKTYYKEGDTWQSLYEAMVLANPSIDADLARAAAQKKANGGRMGPKTRRALERMGIKLPANRRATHPGAPHADDGSGQSRPT